MSDVAPELDAIWKLPSRWAEAHWRRPRSPLRTAQGGEPQARPRGRSPCSPLDRSADVPDTGRRVTALAAATAHMKQET